MAAAQITPTGISLQHIMPLLYKAQRGNAGDWIVIEGYKGVIPLAGMGQSIAASLSESVPTWGVASINNGGDAYTATSTSIVVGSATITRKAPYYLATASGEIMEVLSDSAPGVNAATLTVRRGCLGTTASATGLANTNVLGIMNILFMAANNVGPNFLVLLPLPNDAGAKAFA